jgi:hypothetical protein
MSKDTFPKLLSKIDGLTRGDHFYLAEDDECYFFGDYTTGAGYSGPTNDLIINFKKQVDRKGRPEWRYKGLAIESASEAFSKALNEKFLLRATLVPMPPSKGKTDPLYDDRLLQMLRGIDSDEDLDIRELIVQDGTRAGGAHGGERIGPQRLAEMYAINEPIAAPVPKAIGLFDDTLVTGASFKAAQSVLAARYPGVKIYGFFLARRVLPVDDEPLNDV